jgi:hypothetical protein
MAARCGVEAPLLDPAPTALDAILPTTLTIVGGVASVVEVVAASFDGSMSHGAYI